MVPVVGGGGGSVRLCVLSCPLHKLAPPSEVELGKDLDTVSLPKLAVNVWLDVHAILFKM